MDGLFLVHGQFYNDDFWAWSEALKWDGSKLCLPKHGDFITGKLYSSVKVQVNHSQEHNSSGFHSEDWRKASVQKLYRYRCISKAEKPLIPTGKLFLLIPS